MFVPMIGSASVPTRKCQSIIDNFTLFEPNSIWVMHIYTLSHNNGSLQLSCMKCLDFRLFQPFPHFQRRLINLDDMYNTNDTHLFSELFEFLNQVVWNIQRFQIILADLVFRSNQNVDNIFAHCQAVWIAGRVLPLVQLTQDLVGAVQTQILSTVSRGTQLAQCF